MGVHLHDALQPMHDGGSGSGPEDRLAADARRSVSQMGGVPEEILYDRMKTVWLGSDERGEIVWHPVFLDFARF